MTPQNKKRFKWLACYWFASICLVWFTGGFEESHPHVAFADSVIVTIAIAPLAPVVAVVGSLFSIFSPKAWPDLVRTVFQFCWAFGLPFLAATLIVLKKPARLYSYFSGG